MKHPERVEDYLEHMSEAIDRATTYLQQVDSVEAFEQNPQIQDAVARNIEILGEAANHIQYMDPAFAASHPELPWPEMRGMRNKMVHGYFDIERETVWGTVKTDLPQLKQQVERVLVERRQEQEQARERDR
jgi:uncharacterized protein with HEPN domain